MRHVGIFVAVCLVVTAWSLGIGSAMADDAKKQAQQAGLENYNAYCINCHGINMVNIGTRSFDLRKFPLKDRARFFKSVKDGKKAMPGWKDVLSEEEIKQIWAYVKTRGKL